MGIIKNNNIEKYLLFLIIIYLSYKIYESVIQIREGAKNKNKRSENKRSGKKRSENKRSGKKRRRNKQRGKKRRLNKCSMKAILKKCKKKRKNDKKICLVMNKIKCNKIKCNLGTPDKKSVPNNDICPSDILNNVTTFEDTYKDITENYYKKYYGITFYNDKSNTSFIDNRKDFISLGLKIKNIFDRRVCNSEDTNCEPIKNTKTYVFYVTFGKKSKKIIEIIVNANDFDQHNATTIVKKYSRMLGRVPGFLLCNLNNIHINKGQYHWGGVPATKSIVIHTDMEQTYNEYYNIYDVIIHELTHASLDNIHLNVSGWKAAIVEDCNFFSNYAKEFKTREDLAVTIPKYVAYSISKKLNIKIPDLEKIAEEFSARFKYLDRLNLNMDILK